MTYALQWSHALAAFRVTLLERLASENRQAYTDGAAPADWSVLYVGTKDECEAAGEASMGTAAARSLKKALK